MPQYALLLRDEPATFANFSPEDMQRTIERYRAWRLSLPDRMKGGAKLVDGGGRVLRQRGGKPHVTDGPYSESKEVMAGFFLLEADSYDHAVEISKTCPHMDFGTIEVREIE